MIKRDSYLNRMIRNMWNGEVKVITGIRRCGKSVHFYDNNGIFHCNLIDFLLGRVNVF